jgi:hypothetical protein
MATSSPVQGVNTTTMVVATAGIVTIGRWVQDRPLSPRVVVGGAVLALSLGLLSEVNTVFGKRMAGMVLLTAAFMYVPHIAYSAGLTKVKPPDWEFWEPKDEEKKVKAPYTNKQKKDRRFRPGPPRPGHGGTARGGPQ